jgi:hypothetical protein
MADLHLGATSDPNLRRFEIETLEKAIDRCICEDVAFILLAGDIFHVNIPDLGVVKDSVRTLMRFVGTGKKIYVVYGSHDFSPNSTSIIDILEEAGVLLRVGKPSVVEGKLRPEVVVDEPSGVRITGISGRRASLEKEAFINLDREYLASLKGPKIFMFHTGIEEIRKEGEKFEGISSSDLPEGFDYYAGGHIHRRIETRGNKIVYPGPLFTGWGIDLENTVKGDRRGFYLVDMDKGFSAMFEDVTSFQGVYRELDATGLTSQAVNSKLKAIAGDTDVKGKVVVVKVLGEMASGKTSDIEFSAFREGLMDNGAIYLHLSRYQLRSREISELAFAGDEQGEIEDKILGELAGTLRVKDAILRERSPHIAKDLLAQLRGQKQEGETQSDYDAKMSSAAIETLGIKKLMES